MTKHLGLSAVAAIAALSTSLIAGSVTGPTTPGTIGEEALSIADVTVQEALGAVGEVTYTPTDIPASSVKNPIFQYTFDNVKALAIDGNISVFEALDGNASNTTDYSNWKQVATNPTTASGNVLSFTASNADIYATNDKKYIVAESNGTAFSAPDINATMTKGTNCGCDLKVGAKLYAGDSQQLVDTAAATTIAQVGKEYEGEIDSKYNARIDAADSFQTFFDQHDSGADTNDTATFKFTRNTVLAGTSLDVNTSTFNLFFDQNLTKNNYVAGSSTGGIYNIVTNDNNLTADANVTTTTSVPLQLTVDGSSEIKKTGFSVHAYVTKGDATFDIIDKCSNNAGEWTIYGYTAQIPNVVGIPGKIDTTMKFTNRSGLSTNIYFTLIDPDGTIASVSSADHSSISAIGVDETGRYKASELLDLVTNANFNKSGSISVEVAIPTTPDSVYGMASFKNLHLGQFKDLPIYNSSSMDY